MRFSKRGRWTDQESGETLVEDLYLADSFWQRFLGLQFLRTLGPTEGLLLRGCNSVHTMWMRFAIDIVFLNEDLEIIEIQTAVKPWRFAIPKQKAFHTLEVAAGNAKAYAVGQCTAIVDVADVHAA